mgnify:CR=1 FL=1|jgi:hypothetical protein
MTYQDKNKIHWIDPMKVIFCTSASDIVDLSQHKANKNHHHAYFDRGYFFEDKRRGEVTGGDWDVSNIEFDKLLEYRALLEHYSGKTKWINSQFAERIVQSISLGFKIDGFSDGRDFIKEKEIRINKLFDSISKSGVHPTAGKEGKACLLDDISINIDRYGSPLFNNRGHHRLSIAKILNINTIPVQIIVRHKLFVQSKKLY